jgi:hypothetical protein
MDSLSFGKELRHAKSDRAADGMMRFLVSRRWGFLVMSEVIILAIV